MSDPQFFEISLFVALGGGFDAVDVEDGLPKLDHFKTIADVLRYLAWRGVDPDSVVQAGKQLTLGNSAVVLGNRRQNT
jgi:hypothetical protein